MPPIRMSRVTASHRIACLIVAGGRPREAERLWEVLGGYSPSVEREEADPWRFYLDAGGVAPRYGDEAGWGHAVLADAWAAVGAARLGLAGSKFAAGVAARTALPATNLHVVTEPDAAFLAPLPLDELPLSDEAQRRLRLLGMHTMGQLAALPRVAVAEQFGPESLTAWRWARGQDDRPVRGRRCRTVAASHDFGAPETRAEALLVVATHLAERALRDLPVGRRAWAIRRVRLEARTAEGEALRVGARLGDVPGPETLRALLGRMIGRLPRRGESAGIAELTVSLWGLEPAPARQLALLEAQDTDPQWRQVVRFLQRRYPGNLLRPVLADPEAPIPTERYALRVWTP